jgi:negative regulator of sigma E activity
MMDRHATIDELLAVRDGEGSTWAKDHAALCAVCSAELFGLEQLRARLKALPAYAPPRDRWPVVAAAAKLDRRRRWMRSAVGVAAAAALTALTFAVMSPRAGQDAATRAALDKAMARSQALEQTLQSLEPENRALTASAASAVAALEDRLSNIDAQLGDPKVWQGGSTRAADLWQQRAGVLSALVDVHVTRVASAGL